MVTAPRLVQKGGVYVKELLSLIVAIAAGVISHYICKWLDDNE